MAYSKTLKLAKSEPRPWVEEGQREVQSREEQKSWETHVGYVAAVGLMNTHLHHQIHLSRSPRQASRRPPPPLAPPRPPPWSLPQFSHHSLPLHLQQCLALARVNPWSTHLLPALMVERAQGGAGLLLDRRPFQGSEGRVCLRWALRGSSALLCSCLWMPACLRGMELFYHFKESY